RPLRQRLSVLGRPTVPDRAGALLLPVLHVPAPSESGLWPVGGLPLRIPVRVLPSVLLSRCLRESVRRALCASGSVSTGCDEFARSTALQRREHGRCELR